MSFTKIKKDVDQMVSLFNSFLKLHAQNKLLTIQVTMQFLNNTSKTDTTISDKIILVPVVKRLFRPVV